jgi:cytochrome c553
MLQKIRYRRERPPFVIAFDLCVLLAFGIAFIGNATTNAGASQTPTLADIPFAEADLDIGAEINEVCAGCHGPHGQGGKAGEYPRLAGMPATFIARQLLLFRSRARTNLAMVEYIDHRQMPDEDIAHISVFLSQVDLPSRLPMVESDGANINAYQRLLEAERVVQIPPAPGDVQRGGALYRRECASCHGRDGQGDHSESVPMLAGQYTEYLWRQVPKYLNKQRIHDPSAPDDELLSAFSRAELEDMFAYISRLDD